MTPFLTNATFFNDATVWVRVRIKCRARVTVLIWARVMVRAREGFKVLQKVVLRKVICEKS